MRLCDERGIARPRLSQVIYNLLIRQIELEYQRFARRSKNAVSTTPGTRTPTWTSRPYISKRKLSAKPSNPALVAEYGEDGASGDYSVNVPSSIEP